jgi:hypothetical protein
MPEKKFKQVCTCTNCGNDAEMEITCSLQEVPDEPLIATPTTEATEKHLAEGHGVCSHCGNEADMWIDIES